MNEYKYTFEEMDERKRKYLEEEDRRNNHWKTLADEYRKLISVVNYFSNVIIENNEEINQIAFSEGYNDTCDWILWEYDPDKDYEGDSSN